MRFTTRLLAALLVTSPFASYATGQEERLADAMPAEDRFDRRRRALQQGRGLQSSSTFRTQITHRLIHR